MELFLLFSEIIIEKMTDFKPDIVIFIEESPCDKMLVEAKVKAMILN